MEVWIETIASTKAETELRVTSHVEVWIETI